MRATASGVLTDVGWSTSIPSSRAATATGGGPSLRPRPCLASGRVTTSAGRCGPSARSRRTAAANAEVPRKTSGTGGASGPLRRVAGGVGLEGGAQGAHALLALIARGAVEDEDAVEVVDLVLDHARFQAAGLDEDVLAVAVLGAHADVDRALDVDVHGGQAETALLGPLLVLAGPLDDRVDQGVDRAVGLDAVDEDAVQDPDLGGGQADAVGVVHQRAHALDLLAQVVVEPLDPARLGAQDRIAELAHVGQRRAAPGQGLGVEGRRLGRLVELFVVLGHAGQDSSSAQQAARRARMLSTSRATCRGSPVTRSQV